jgi:hypothetical protein
MMAIVVSAGMQFVFFVCAVALLFKGSRCFLAATFSRHGFARFYPSPIVNLTTNFSFTFKFPRHLISHRQWLSGTISVDLRRVP